MVKLRITPLVASDLKDIRNYIADDDPDTALKTIQEIYRQFENIQLFPEAGTDLQRKVSFKTDYKYTVYKNYVILYKTRAEYVEIYRIISRFQDLTRIFEESF